MFTTGEVNVTEGEPSITNGEADVTTGDPSITGGEPNVTTGEADVTAGEDTFTNGEPNFTFGEPSFTEGLDISRSNGFFRRMEPVWKNLDGVKSSTLALALSVPVRWHILGMMAGGKPLSVTRAARSLDMKRSTLSKHMRVLLDAGLVAVGTGRLYSIAPGVEVEDGGRALRMGPFTLHLAERAAEGEG